jgi:hypothetical protein
LHQNSGLYRAPLIETLEKRITFNADFEAKIWEGGKSLGVADRSNTAEYNSPTQFEETAGQAQWVTIGLPSGVAQNISTYNNGLADPLDFTFQVGGIGSREQDAVLGEDYELWWQPQMHSGVNDPPVKVTGSTLTAPVGSAGYGYLYVDPIRKQAVDPVEGPESFYVELTGASGKVGQDKTIGVDDNFDHDWAVINDGQPWENEIYCQCECGDQAETILKVGGLTGAAGLKHLVSDSLSMMYWGNKDATKYITFKGYLPYFVQNPPDVVQAEMRLNGALAETVYIVYPVPAGEAGFSRKVAFTFKLPTDSFPTGVYDWDLTLTYGNIEGIPPNQYFDAIPLAPTAPGSDTYSGENLAIVNRHNSEFGDGWSIEGLDRIVPVTGGALLVTGEGNAFFFEGSGTTFQRPAGEPGFSTLTYSGGRYLLTDKYGIASAFRNVGSETNTPFVLDYREDRNGNRITYNAERKTYNGQNIDVYTGIVDPARGTTTFNYPAGPYTSPPRVSSITEFSGTTNPRTTSIAIDSTTPGQTGYVKSITSAAPAPGQAPSKTSFDYYLQTSSDGAELQNHLKSVRVQTNPLDTTQDFVRTVRYDRGKGVAEIFSDEIRPTDDTKIRRFQGANPARILQQRPTSTSGSMANPAQFSLVDFADEQLGTALNIDDLTSVQGERTDHHGVNESVRVDHLGYETFIDRGGYNISQVRDTEGLFVESTTSDPDGAESRTGTTTKFAYDPKGNLLTETISKVGGGVLSSQAWTYEPDYSQVIEHTDPIGRLTKYSIGPLAGSIQNRGNVLSITQVVGAIDSGAETNDVVTKYTYTTGPSVPAGLVDTETDAIGRVTKYNYESHGLVTQVINNFGTSNQTDVEHHYNAQLQRDWTLDELNRKTEWLYDDLGRLTSKPIPIRME